LELREKGEDLSSGKLFDPVVQYWLFPFGAFWKMDSKKYFKADLGMVDFFEG
jgi:hypothetical protein